MPYIRSCLVSFTDIEGIEHAVRVPAESLFEAAVGAMASFRRCGFADVTLAPGTPSKIRVRAPEDEHREATGKLRTRFDQPQSRNRRHPSHRGPAISALVPAWPWNS